MAVKFFGQYLVEKGIVNSDTLLKAIELQEMVNLSFGETALAMGFMAKETVDRVNQAQRTEDMRFGDLAVKLQLLTPEQMMQILARQKSEHLYIGEALVRVGGLSTESLKQYLDEFKADQAKYVTDRVVIPAGAPHTDFLELSADLTYKMLTRVALLNFRPDEARLVDRLGSHDVVAAMDFFGDINARYIIAVSAEVQAKIARAILSEENVDDEPAEVLEDTVMEFVNVVCGNIVAKAAQSGKSIDIKPPEILDATNGIPVPPGEVGILFPVCLAEGGQVEMALFIKA